MAQGSGTAEPWADRRDTPNRNSSEATGMHSPQGQARQGPMARTREGFLCVAGRGVSDIRLPGRVLSAP